MDRGSKSKQTLECVMELVNLEASALRGNHDQMFLDFINSDNPKRAQHYMMNGGQVTLETYVGKDHFENGVTMENLESAKSYIKTYYQDHIDFISGLLYYVETDNHLFIHAGIDPGLDDWRDTLEYDMIWIHDAFFRAEHPYDFTVVHGHTPAQFIREIKIIIFISVIKKSELTVHVRTAAG